MVKALAAKHALASDVPSPLLTFCDQTGQVVDIDIRGSDAEMFARLPPEGCQLRGNESALINSVESGAPRGRGRPKLGVVAREVTLLPRHRDWLAAQPGGPSVTLRKLVEEARRANVDRDRQRRANECAYHFMSTMAGDMAGLKRPRGRCSRTTRKSSASRPKLGRPTFATTSGAWLTRCR